MSRPAAPQSKQQLRTMALAAREALTAEQRTAAALAIAAHKLPFDITPGAVVSGYSPIRGELDPTPLMLSLAARGARLALPAIMARGKALSFRAWSPGDRLTLGSLGILEPSPVAEELTPDIMLVPLAAFDHSGHRIGYGGGYYDYTFSHLRETKHVIGVGLGFVVQQIKIVPALAHDVPLDYVLTEQEVFDFRSG